MRSKAFISILILLSLFTLSFSVSSAQESSGSTPIEFTGLVEAINGTLITVSGLTVDASGIDPALLSQLALGSQVTVSGTLSGGIVTASGLVIQAPPGTTLNGFIVSYGGRVFDGSSTTFTYVVTGTGISPDLSHFDLGIPQCQPALQITGFSPTDAVRFGVDPTTGIDGIKWDLPLGVNETRSYSISFAGDVPEGSVMVAVKGGDGFTAGSRPGPACPQSSIDVEKFVSGDGGATWADADSVPGIVLPLTGEVQFRFVVTNTSDQELSAISLSDSDFSIAACAIPATLAPSASFECIIGPFPAEAGQHQNAASVSATSGAGQVSDSDLAHYFGGELDDDDDDDLPITIIIEGPVQEVNINIITIFDIDIEIDDDDPLLTVIQIGDTIRVEGDTVSDGTTIIIIAINITIINVEVFINDDDGQVWRDPGNCSNPPPPWAPANGWRRRCSGGGDSNRSSGGGDSNRDSDRSDRSRRSSRSS